MNPPCSAVLISWDVSIIGLLESESHTRKKKNIRFARHEGQAEHECYKATGNETRSPKKKKSEKPDER
jgi:hypothetical protein